MIPIPITTKYLPSYIHKVGHVYHYVKGYIMLKILKCCRVTRFINIAELHVA